jgi:glutathione S-transferase
VGARLRPRPVGGRVLVVLAEQLGAVLENRFTAADLLMVTVLRILRHTDIISADPVLGPYLARGEARPAFQRALAAQLAPFRENAPEMEPA